MTQDERVRARVPRDLLRDLLCARKARGVTSCILWMQDNKEGVRMVRAEEGGEFVGVVFLEKT